MRIYYINVIKDCNSAEIIKSSNKILFRCFIFPNLNNILFWEKSLELQVLT